MKILIVKNPEEGIEKAKEELYKRVDNRTVLFLSGGKTPIPLYGTLVKEEIIKPAVVGLVDERFGNPMHANSNEFSIANTGLLSYFSKQQIPFYPILQKNLDREQTARNYDRKTRDLFFQFPKSVAIVGIGKDGHTAGIAPNRKDFKNPLFDASQKDLYVSEFDDNDVFGERVTMTFNGLALIDYLIVLVFGKDKQKALTKALSQGSMEETPARFYQLPDITNKTVIITDQKVV